MWKGSSFCILLLIGAPLWRFIFAEINKDFESEYARQILRLAKSVEMRNYLQTNIDPCDDFYKYACGNWSKINPAKSDPKTYIFNILSKAYDRKLTLLLNSPKSSINNEMDRKVKYFYESCLNKTDVRRNFRQNLLSVMEEFGGMPALKGDQWQIQNFDWLDVVARILRKYGKQIILGVDIFADLTNNDINRLYIGQLDELVSSDAPEYYIRLELGRSLELQKVFNINEELAYSTASAMVKFERALAKGISEPCEGLGMEDKTRLRLLEEMTEIYKPVLNFTRFSQIWLDTEYKLPVYEYVETYLINLRILLLNTPAQTVANYIMWQLIQDFRLETENSDSKHQAKCIKMTKRHFIKYLDNMIYRYLSQNYKSHINDVYNVWGQLKRAFDQRLQSTDVNWLTVQTKDKALEKLSAMSLEINSYESENFDKYFSSLVISSDNYFENIVNIMENKGRNYRRKLYEPPKLERSNTLSFTPAYAPEFNRVLIPVAFLQPRYLWDNVYPASLKYSTLGYILAHELAHAYDDINRKYDAKGNLNNWWDRNSTEEFIKRKDCLRRKFREYNYNGGHLPESNAYGENIADNVAVRIAFSAYENWLLQNQYNPSLLESESLSQLNFTPRQLFFVSLAQMWCSDVQRQLRHLLTTTDLHAPEEIRVLAMLSNFDNFATEFQCPIGIKMHPREKCTIY